MNRPEAFDRLARFAVERGLPLELLYHPDADPGDGSGWAVMLGDRWAHGSIEDAASHLLDGREHREVPHE